MPDGVTRAVIGAIASWPRLEAAVKLAEVAAMEGDADAAARERDNAHAALDVHIDAKQAAARLIESGHGQARRDA